MYVPPHISLRICSSVYVLPYMSLRIYPSVYVSPCMSFRVCASVHIVVFGWVGWCTFSRELLARELLAKLDRSLLIPSFLELCLDLLAYLLIRWRLLFGLGSAANHSPHTSFTTLFQWPSHEYTCVCPGSFMDMNECRFVIVLYWGCIL